MCAIVIRLSAPFKDPRTGVFYFRPVIPAVLRSFFNGGASEYKRTLDTRDPEEARQRYHSHAVVYEQKLATARRTRARHHLRSTRAMVDDFLDGQPDEDLRGVAQKLAALEPRGVRLCQRPYRRCVRRPLRLGDFAKPR